MLEQCQLGCVTFALQEHVFNQRNKYRKLNIPSEINIETIVIKNGIAYDIG